MNAEDTRRLAGRQLLFPFGLRRRLRIGVENGITSKANPVNDGRSYSRMDPDTRMVHSLLEQWGRWSYDSSLRAYPSVTLLGRVIECGANGASQQGRPPLEMPAAVAATDSAIAKLCQTDKRVIVVYYTREEPIEVCARKCRMRIRQFQNVLRRARWRLVLHLHLSDCVQSAISVRA